MPGSPAGPGYRFLVLSHIPRGACTHASLITQNEKTPKSQIKYTSDLN